MVKHEQLTTYQSSLIDFAAIKNTLNFLCGNMSSGLFIVVDDCGDDAGFLIMQGKIIEVSYKKLRGNDALVSIKNIERARYYFEQDKLFLTSMARDGQNIPDTSHVLEFLDIKSDVKANKFNDTCTESH